MIATVNNLKDVRRIIKSKCQIFNSINQFKVVFGRASPVQFIVRRQARDVHHYFCYSIYFKAYTSVCNKRSVMFGQHLNPSIFNIKIMQNER